MTCSFGLAVWEPEAVDHASTLHHAPWATRLDADQIIESWAKVFEVIGFIVALLGRITEKTLISGLTGCT